MTLKKPVLNIAQDVARNGRRDAGAALVVEDVHLKLASAAGEVNILRGVDLNVVAGETVGLVGPSGSGKTSLLMLIAGLERASAGRIRVAGTEITGLGEDALAAFRGRHVGIVFQNFHLVPTMTALENVALPLEFAAAADAMERARAQLTAVGLGHRLTHFPGQLSGGEQQRVALARAFVVEPSLLLADEPTGNLDGVTGAAVMEVLFDLHRRCGTTLILVTHEDALARRCSRIVRMADGRVADGAPDSVAPDSAGPGSVAPDSVAPDSVATGIFDDGVADGGRRERAARGAG